jgi:hypothetical protein
MVRLCSVAFLSLSLVGCTVGDTGGGGAGGPDAGLGGNGSSDAPVTTPRVASTIDKATVTSGLGKDETVTLTLTSQGDFAGPVTIAASLVNAQGQSLAPVTVQGPASVTLSAGQSMPATYTISIPSNASSGDFTGILKLALSSSAGTEELTSSLSIAATYTFDIPDGTGTATENHPSTGKTISLKRGAQISVHNSDSIKHVTHGTGLAHEADAGGQPGGTYTVSTTAIAPGTSGVLIGCHLHGGNGTYATVKVE